MTTHIVRAFNNDMQQLRRLVLDMGSMTIKQVDLALEVLLKRNQVAGVVSSDLILNQQEQKIDTQALHILALRHPQADDLREVVAVSKIAVRLERIGDYATNVARHSALWVDSPPPQWLVDKMVRMGRLALGLIEDGMQAYKEISPVKALRVARNDGDIDRLYEELCCDLIAEMEQNPATIKSCSYSLFIAKFLERIGDHAVGVAKNIHFLATGKHLTQHL